MVPARVYRVYRYEETLRKPLDEDPLEFVSPDPTNASPYWMMAAHESMKLTPQHHLLEFVLCRNQMTTRVDAVCVYCKQHHPTPAELDEWNHSEESGYLWMTRMFGRLTVHSRNRSALSNQSYMPFIVYKTDESPESACKWCTV